MAVVMAVAVVVQLVEKVETTPQAVMLGVLAVLEAHQPGEL
jgi:hypothetical protein